jgi:hypothetical protein
MTRLGNAPKGVYSDDGQALMGLVGPDGSTFPLISGDGLILVPNSISAAASNSAAIQAALNKGGLIEILTPGVYYVAPPHIQPSDCLVYLGPGVELKQVPGSVFQSFFTNQRYTPVLTTIKSITFSLLPVTVAEGAFNFSFQGSSQMARASVTTATAHGLSAGDPVIIDGDIQFQANGGHIVEQVISSTNFTYLLAAQSAIATPLNTASIPQASLTGTIAGNILTVTSITGAIVQGQALVNNSTLTGAIAGQWANGVTNGVIIQAAITGFSLSACSFYGYVMTVTGVSGGTLAVGQTIKGTGIAPSTIITQLGTGTGGNGTYIVSTNTGTVTVNTQANSGATSIILNNASNIACGQLVTGTNIAANTTITNIVGNTIYLNNAITGNVLANATLTVGNSGTSGTVYGGIGTYYISGQNTNPTFPISSCSFSSNVMTVNTINAGNPPLAAGQVLSGTNITAGTSIVAQLTGSAGSTGTYQVSTTTCTATSCTVNPGPSPNSTSFTTNGGLGGSFNASASGTTLTYSSSPAGNYFDLIGLTVVGAGIPAGTTIVSGTGPYTLSANVGTISAEAMTFNLSLIGIGSTIEVSKCDKNIGVFGPGRLNGNYIEGNMLPTANNQAGGTYLDHGITYNNIMHPFVGGGDNCSLTIDDCSQYCVMIGMAVAPKAIGLFSNFTRKDGVHFMGPIYGHPIIKDIEGSFGDDVAIFENCPNYSYAPLLAPNWGGNFYEGGTIENIRVTFGGNSGIAVLYPSQSAGGGNYPVGSSAFRMFGRFNIKNVGHKYPYGYGASDSAFAVGPYCSDQGFVDVVNVDGAVGNIAAGNTSAGNIFVSDMSIKNWTSFPVADSIGSFWDYVTIDRLDIEANISASSAGTANFPIYLNSNNVTIRELILSGRFDCKSNNGLTVLWPNSVGGGPNIGLLTYKDIIMIGDVQLLYQIASFSNTPEITLDGINGQGLAPGSNILGFGGSTPMNIMARDINTANAGITCFNFGTNFVNLDFENVKTGGKALFGTGITNLTLVNPTPYLPTQRFTPASGTTVALINLAGCQRVILAPTGAFTLALPANPINGEVIELSFATGGYAVTQSGGTLQGLAGSPAANFGGKWVYSSADSTWLQY